MFYNKLTLEDISDEQCLHAQHVWKEFNCQNLKEYSDLYLKTDVPLLADVFKKFRRVCFKTYELLTDIDQVHFVKKGIRRGISQCSLQHAKANNKYMETYDANSPSELLMYWDVNNLNGWAMSQFIPVSDFKWLSENEIKNLDFNNIRDISDFGYILDVDIEYPEILHDLHNDLPFLAENLLPPNAVAHGLKVCKINRVLSFRQSAWLKSYIDKNTELRQSAKNAFEKDFFKLINNAVFGKTMENVDKRVDIRLVTSGEDVQGQGAEMADVDEHGLDVLPNNKENYISFSKTVLVDKVMDEDRHVDKNFLKLRFVDSFRFMASSLDSLADNLEKYVDIEYPENLHDLHNDLPFLAENLLPPNGKCESDKRLIPNLFNKKNYVVHYRNLKQAVAHGLKVYKINRVLSFKQSAWLKSYIDKNTELRQSAKNAFEKDFFKLMNNAVFGKTMENVDKRVDVRLVTSWEDICMKTGRPKLGARSLIAKLNFKNIKTFTETFSAIQMERLHIVYDKPLYVGFTVLELSKLLMYNFFYGFLKPKYGEGIRLCYMDTDSFTVLINSNDVYTDVKLNLNKFDTSNYSPDNQFDVPLQNKAVLGLMKDENCGEIMEEFVGLRSKVYANRVADGRVTKKSKGVKKAVVKRKITFENYIECLNSKAVLFRKQLSFRSFHHIIFTMLQNKLVLSPNDTKRCICNDGIDTLAWGHHGINNSV
nr:uncharacterized protein LOC111419606 [Onthophagus taurus]